MAQSLIALFFFSSLGLIAFKMSYKFVGHLILTKSFINPLLLFLSSEAYHFYSYYPLAYCTLISIFFQPRLIYRKLVLNSLLSEAATSYKMIINIVEAFYLSICTSCFKVDKLNIKAILKTPLTVTTNTTQLGLDYNSVII